MRVGIRSWWKLRALFYTHSCVNKRVPQFGPYASLGAACELTMQTTSIICVYNQSTHIARSTLFILQRWGGNAIGTLLSLMAGQRFLMS